MNVISDFQIRVNQYAAENNISNLTVAMPALISGSDNHPSIKKKSPIKPAVVKKTQKTSSKQAKTSVKATGK